MHSYRAGLSALLNFLSKQYRTLTKFLLWKRPPHDHLLFPITPDWFEQFKTVGNISTEFTDLPGPYPTRHRPFPTSHRPDTTFPDHQGRERSAPKSAKCDQGFSDRDLVTMDA